MHTHLSFKTGSVCLLLLVGAACGDAASTETSTSSATSESEGESEQSASTDAPSESSTEGESESGSETGTPTDTEGESDTDSDSATDTSDAGTTGEEPACDGMDPLVGSWSFNLIGGDFPNDLPTDAEENCELLASAPAVLSVSCPSFALDIEVNAMPAPQLPAPTTDAMVRVHHEPGWLNWPDLWIDVEVPGDVHWSFTSASVLTPTQGEYIAPWAPAQADLECGPFLVEDMFGPDGCGEQLGHAVEFEVDGAPVLAWHATHFELDIDGRGFAAWMGAVREYIAPPEFCDVSPTWFSIITQREL